MPALGSKITVTYDEARKLRKEGWRPCPDVVTMEYVGKPDAVPSNRQKANARPRRTGWTDGDHDFVNRKLGKGVGA